MVRVSGLSFGVTGALSERQVLNPRTLCCPRFQTLDPELLNPAPELSLNPDQAHCFRNSHLKPSCLGLF